MEAGQMALNREQISAILGPVDEDLMAGIAALDATEAELQEAKAWLAADEAFANEGRPPPSGRVAELLDLLQADEASADE
jgi:hypothetical protein